MIDKTHGSKQGPGKPFWPLPDYSGEVFGQLHEDRGSEARHETEERRVSLANQEGVWKNLGPSAWKTHGSKHGPGKPSWPISDTCTKTGLPNPDFAPHATEESGVSLANQEGVWKNVKESGPICLELPPCAILCQSRIMGVCVSMYVCKRSILFVSGKRVCICCIPNNYPESGTVIVYMVTRLPQHGNST